jgi:ubiquinone/menaquinone biosynthesis C-methylase UbiE
MPTAASSLARHGSQSPPTASATVFQEEWQVYRKVVDNNYLFHREAYAVLRNLLVEEMTAPFRFLDIACGDASATVGALAGTRVQHYHGIDLSEPALALAKRALRELPCPFELTRQDFVATLRERNISADIAWIGLSLHHLRRAQKLGLMLDARMIVGEAGKLLVYENASPGPETRAAWMKRWDRQRGDWRTFSDSEWASIRDHVHANDHPEAHVTWLELGYEAGFGRARCLYESPTQLFRLYCFDC